MRYFLVVGEPSGDVHASKLMQALLEVDSAASFQYIGGEAMRSVAPTCLRDAKELAIMGFVEVLTHLRTISRNLAQCVDSIEAWKPDVVILVDFSGFNLKVAEYCHAHGYKVAYYILPKVWAWGAGRLKKMRRDIDWFYAILPFEVEYFRKNGIEVNYLGNPLLDELPQCSEIQPDADFRRQHDLDSRPIVALLPGSRPQELASIFERMCQLANEFPSYQFVVAGTSAIPAETYQKALARYPEVKLVTNITHQLLLHAQTAIVTSGTATLETALLGIPQVVVYRGNPLSIWIARRLAKVRRISLVNLILNRDAVKELIQEDFNLSTLRAEWQKLLPASPDREKMLNDYAELQRLVGEAGCAKRIASDLYTKLTAKTKAL